MSDDELHDYSQDIEEKEASVEPIGAGTYSLSA
jgi:hypothetical protein